MISPAVVLASLQIQNQTGYAPDFTRSRASCLVVPVAESDDTGLDSSLVFDPMEGPQQAAPSIQILGEVFRLETDGDLGIVISHPKWSLMGYGSSVAEAERMLMDYARDLAETMVDDTPSEYTKEGNRLREFVLRFLYLFVESAI